MSVSFSNLIDLLNYRALHQGNSRLYTFLENGETEAGTLTYQELADKSQKIAAALSRQAPNVLGERAILLYEPSLEYILAVFGCLYAGIVAVSLYPPDPSRLNKTLPKMHSIIENAKPIFGLTSAKILRVVEIFLGNDPMLKKMSWIATDKLPEEQFADSQKPLLNKDTVAFLQYTSGSTRSPRGVITSHGNLLFNSEAIARCFEHSSASKEICWLPPYHDMGLSGGIFQPLYAGFPAVFLSPLSFLQKPFRWLKAISVHRGTSSGGPNFAYDLCVRKITA